MSGDLVTQTVAAAETVAETVEGTSEGDGAGYRWGLEVILMFRTHAGGRRKKYCGLSNGLLRMES